MKTYYLYRIKGSRRKFVAELEAESDDKLRKIVKREHPDLDGWDALRKKYVKDKRTGELHGPPYPVDTTAADWTEQAQRHYKRLKAGEAA